MKKVLKVFLILISIIVILAMLAAISLFAMSSYMKNISEMKKYYDRGISIIPTADYIVVPGAQITRNMPSMILGHRLEYAYKLYEEKKAPKIIVSGGFDEKVGKYEAEVMYTYLVKLGVAKEDIISDLNGNSTYETLKRVKEYVGDKSIIFCTQEIYSDRAVFIANHLNLNMNVFCSDPMIYTSKGKALIRENLAKGKAVLNCTIFPAQTKSIETQPFYSK